MLDDTTIEARIESGAFGGAPARVLGMRSREALSQPFEVHLEIAVGEPDFDASALLGRDFVVTVLRTGAERRWVGLATEIAEGSTEGEETRTSVVLAPAWRLLALRRNTRMFQERSVPEILETVLNEALEPYGRSARLELDGSYDPREYCLQYQESDLDFVHRLMEEEGIAYHFDHAGDLEEAVLVDANTAYPVAATRAGDGAVSFRPHGLSVVSEEPVHRFEIERSETTTAVTVRDFDWTQGTLPITEEAATEDASGRTRESYEHGLGRQVQIGSYDEGVSRYQKNDAARQASLRREAAFTFATVAHGESRVVALAPGRTIALSDHPSVGADGEYLVTAVECLIGPSPGGDDRTEPYSNRFVCIPLATPFRPPRRTAKPKIHGVQTAVVTGPSGEEIHTDEHGRVMVLFHWDRENGPDEKSSCWLRVKQEWAGAGWGFWWVPRIGMEVAVHFVDGDPDRPLVTGSVYNGENPTPYGLPDEKTKSTIRSSSSLGGEGFNEIRFEDEAGAEEIFTHAQKDYNEVVENDHTTTVHHDQTNTVDNDQTQSIGANQTERVDVDQSMTVRANRTVHVQGSFEETVDGTETRHTAGDVAESFASNETRTIGGNVDETIGSNEARRVGAAQSESISGNHTLTVGADSTLDVSGALSQSVDGGITTTTPAAFSANATAGWTVTAAGGINMIAPAGVDLQFPAGVTRVDSFWSLLAGKEQFDGKLQLELFATKIGLTGGAAELVLTMKLDFCTSAQSTCGVKLLQSGSDGKWRAVNMEKGFIEYIMSANETDA